MPQSLSNTLRILLLSSPSTAQLSEFRENENYHISTPYYKASIPIWRDSFPISVEELKIWEKDWRSADAGEVIEAIGAWIVCFPAPDAKEEFTALRTALRTVKRTVEDHVASSLNAPDPSFFAILVSNDNKNSSYEIATEEWEDVCMQECGWEFIDCSTNASLAHDPEKEGKNAFGEKIGMARLKEALEATDWQGGSTPDLEDLDIGVDHLDMERSDFRELDSDMNALKTALVDRQGSTEGGHSLDSPGDKDVQALESMLIKMRAIKEEGASLPEAERKRLAAGAVREVLKSIDGGQ